MDTETQVLSRLQEKMGQGVKAGLDLVTGKDVASIRNFVDRQKELHPELASDPLLLSKRMLSKREWFAAAVSFCWGLGGWVTFVPNLAHIWRIHGRLVLTVAYIYGYDLNDPDRREEVALCVALSSGSESVNKLMQEAGMIGAKKALETQVSREFIKSLPNKLITIAGKKSITNVGKIVPILGGFVGGVIDFFGTKVVGEAAIKYYS